MVIISTQAESTRRLLENGANSSFANHHCRSERARPSRSRGRLRRSLAERGVTVSYETVRVWCAHFGPKCARPNRLTTDKLPNYRAVKRDTMPSMPHCTARYQNNRAEVSHERTRSRERQMRKFKSPGQAQRFFAVHDRVQHLFRLGRHLTRAANFRILRLRALGEWQQVTCASPGASTRQSREGTCIVMNLTPYRPPALSGR